MIKSFEWTSSFDYISYVVFIKIDPRNNQQELFHKITMFINAISQLYVHEKILYIIRLYLQYIIIFVSYLHLWVEFHGSHSIYLRS